MCLTLIIVLAYAFSMAKSVSNRLVAFLLTERDPRRQRSANRKIANDTLVPIQETVVE